VLQIGLTGTRSLKLPDHEKQLAATVGLIYGLTTDDYNPVRICQGCCRGFDTEVTLRLVAERPGKFFICGHPPTKTDFVDKRVLPVCNRLMRPKEYLRRDRDIVEHGGDYTIMGPKEYQEIFRGSDSWYTCRQALAANRPTYIVFRQGEVAKAYRSGGNIAWRFLTSEPS